MGKQTHFLKVFPPTLKGFVSCTFLISIISDSINLVITNHLLISPANIFPFAK